MSRGSARADPAAQAFEAGRSLLAAHPVFARLHGQLAWTRSGRSACPPDGWLLAMRVHEAHVHPKRRAEPEQWAQLMARALLLHASGLWRADHGDWRAWSAACDVVTARFVQGLKFGRAPEGMSLPGGLPAWDEERWYREFCREPVPEWALALSLAGPGCPTMQHPGSWGPLPEDYDEFWAKRFAAGIADSVCRAVEVAAGVREELSGAPPTARPGALGPATERARDWFVSSFPLLGSMVAAFEFVEDAELCRRAEISVAAVDETRRTVYLNPAAGLDEQELRFVIAHEVLHVALRHDARRRGRDHFLWNVACDFVINEWLIQMQLGRAPDSVLYDPQLRELSAEEVYDRIATDLRRARRLRTLAGRRCDVLDRSPEEGRPRFTDLDAFCREQLSKGLLLHREQGRGLLPAGLLEEINAVLQPPIPWEVELARWFDHHFPPIETRRSWARLSRRQSSTPDIPRPRIEADPRHREGRTFGVVLDTSGSMDRVALARGLGAIAGYAEAKDVPAVRLICCDAAPYDLGYLPAGEIAGRVQLKGRGGTVLQPGVELLERASDFPDRGPILVITDGWCDPLTIRRDHAYLLPPGGRLPFRPRGEVFEMS